MKVKVKLEPWAKMPVKAHETDAGFDLFAPKRVVLRAGYSAVIDTGVHMMIPKYYVGFLKSKSGLNVKNDITCEGVIDTGYTGTIVAKLRNDSKYQDKVFEEGEKITQIVILPIPEVELEEVDELEETERGDGGFGSTGRF